MADFLHQKLEYSEHLQNQLNDFFPVVDAFNKEFVECCQAFYVMLNRYFGKQEVNNVGCFCAAVHLLVLIATGDFSILEQQMQLLPTPVVQYFFFLLDEQNQKCLHYFTTCFRNHSSINNGIKDLKLKLKTFALLPTFFPIVDISLSQ